MGRETGIRDADVRALLRLMGEVGELPRDLGTRLQHVAGGLHRVLSARTVTLGLVDWPAPAAPRYAGLWFGPDAEEAYGVMVPHLAASAVSEPLSSELVRRANAGWGKGVFSVAWDDVYTRGEWARHPFVSLVCRPAGIQYPAYSMMTWPGTRLSTGIAASRGWADRRPLGRRECAIMNWVHEAMEPLWRRVVHPEGPRLSRRERQVLERLLAGDGAKQVARRLGISTHTVNDYVKSLYRRLGVQSRGELMARFVG